MCLKIEWKKEKTMVPAVRCRDWGHEGHWKGDLSMGSIEKGFGEHLNLGSRLHLRDHEEGEKPTRGKA